MSEPVSVAKQATFTIDTPDGATVSESCGIHLPIATDNLDVVDAQINNAEIFHPASSEKQLLQPSLTSSSRSSPIYATGDHSFKEFRANVLRNFRPSRAPVLGSQASRPSSLGGDTTSELDILSDVGLAGDSDTDAPPPPPGLALSQSARRKVPKGEPRIKIPSAKTDNAEPTIHEETTQDILNLAAVEPNKHSPYTVEEGEAAAAVDGVTDVKKLVSFNLVPDVNSCTPSETPLQAEDTIADQVDSTADLETADCPTLKTCLPEQNIDKTFVTPAGVTEVDQDRESVPLGQENSDSDADENQFNNSLDSSFYESDWQPKQSSASGTLPGSGLNKTDTVRSPRPPGSPGREDNSPGTGRDNNTELTAVSGRDNNTELTAVPGEKHSDCNKSDDSKPINKKGSESQSDILHKFKIKPVVYSRLDAGKRWAKGSHNKQSENSLHTKRTGNEIEVGLSKPTCVSSRTEDKLNTDPVELRAQTPVHTARSSVASNSPLGGSARDDILTNQQQETQKSLAADTPVNMANSDAYGYESETFEEILRDRNDLVKAEKTYQRRIRQLEEELKGMVNQCQMLSDENKELRKKLEETKTPEKEAVSKTDHVELASRVARLETEKENLAKVNEQLKTKLKETEAKTKQFDSVFVENTKLKTKNVELERKTASLTKELQVLTDRAHISDTETAGKIQNANKSTRELQSVVSELREENSALKSRLSSKDERIAGLSSALEEKRTEVSEMMKAMQNETTTETQLRQAHDRFDKAQEEINSLKIEMENLKRMLEESVENRSKLQKSLNQKEVETKKLRADQESKERTITELRGYLDRSKLDLRRLEESQNAYRDVEKESAYLKTRIGSLKAEIESSLTENVRLKHEREDMMSEVDRLRVDAAHTGDAVLESKKYFRKWENEKDARNRMEVELGKKDDDIHVLECRLKEAANQLNSVYAKLKLAEDERSQLANTNMQELNVNNKILVGENKKLRQMLVERNIELTHKNSEQNVFDNRIKLLERKQKDAEVKVKQLSGWVVNAEVTKISTSYNNNNNNNNNTNNHGKQTKQENHHQRVSNHSDMGPSSSSAPSKKSSQSASQPHSDNNNHHMQQQQQQPHHRTRASTEPRQVSRHFNNKSILGVTEPKVAFVSPRARHKVGNSRHKPQPPLTPPPEWDIPNKRGLDRESGSNHTPLSLPPILDTTDITPPDPHGGYFMLYKERVKRLQDRQF